MSAKKITASGLALENARIEWRSTAAIARQQIARKVPRLVDQLAEHVAGDRDMKPSQVNAARTLLDRVVPTVAAVQMVVDEQRRQDRDSLMQRAKALGLNVDQLFDQPEPEPTPVATIRQAEQTVLKAETVKERVISAAVEDVISSGNQAVLEDAIGSQSSSVAEDVEPSSLHSHPPAPRPSVTWDTPDS